MNEVRLDRTGQIIQKAIQNERSSIVEQYANEVERMTLQYFVDFDPGERNYYLLAYREIAKFKANFDCMHQLDKGRPDICCKFIKMMEDVETMWPSYKYETRFQEIKENLKKLV